MFVVDLLVIEMGVFEVVYVEGCLVEDFFGLCFVVGGVYVELVGLVYFFGGVGGVYEG